MAKRINKFMKQAIKEAEKGITNGEGGPFGCVIVKDGKVVGKGHNRVLKNNDPSGHGEVEAIRNAAKKLKTYDLTGCELYTTAQTCPMCYFCCAWSNISKIYYGCTVEDTESIGFRDKKFENVLKDNANELVTQEEIDREACLKLFDRYKNIQHTIY